MRPLHSNILLETLSFPVLTLLPLISHFLHLLHLWIEVRVISSTDDVLTSDIWLVILNIIGNGVIEEDGLLTDHSQRTTQVVDIIVLDIDTIQQYLSCDWIIETLQELMDGRFTAS